jgi:hypothetical protein
MNAHRVALLLPLFVSLVLGACRNSSAEGGSGGAVAMVPSVDGTDGCNGPDQVFTPGQAFAPLTLATWSPWALSQVAGARVADKLFVTGAGATVVEIDVSGAPVETELVSAGTVEDVIDPLHLGPPPELSGLCVLDADNLLVMEHSHNVILLVSRSVPDSVVLFAGLPMSIPGLADGPTSLSRFNLAQAAQIVATGDGRVLLADSGNHVIRQIQDGLVTTLAGTGAPFFADGNLTSSLFDTPSGLTVNCAGRLLITELGTVGAGGHRLRELELGQASFFGQLGTVSTLAGDGTALTVEGVGGLASLAAPMGLVTSNTGQAYFVDTTTGILRRFDPLTGNVDCPLWVDCNAAVTGGGRFTNGGVVSLVSTDAGVLYALDASAGTLSRITP